MVLVFGDGKSPIDHSSNTVSWRRLEACLSYVGKWANAGLAEEVRECVNRNSVTSATLATRSLHLPKTFRSRSHMSLSMDVSCATMPHTISTATPSAQLSLLRLHTQLADCLFDTSGGRK